MCSSRTRVALTLAVAAPMAAAGFGQISAQTMKIEGVIERAAPSASAVVLRVARQGRVRYQIVVGPQTRLIATEPCTMKDLRPGVSVKVDGRWYGKETLTAKSVQVLAYPPPTGSGLFAKG